MRKAKNNLEFELRLQEYIELARARKTVEAIAYAKKYLISWQETHLRQIRQVSALLAFPPTSAVGPYRVSFGCSLPIILTDAHFKRLYDEKRWETLVRDFRLSVYNLNALPNEPLLYLALYCGLASLKLPTCYDESDKSNRKNRDCPICDSEGLGKLAKEVPWSHHVNSTIVCPISGKIINENNPPMMLPNGYVYSREALEAQALKDPERKVTCDRTKMKYDFSSLRKVYVS